MKSFRKTNKNNIAQIYYDVIGITNVDLGQKNSNILAKPIRLDDTTYNVHKIHVLYILYSNRKAIPFSALLYLRIREDDQQFRTVFQKGFWVAEFEYGRVLVLVCKVCKWLNDDIAAISYSLVWLIVLEARFHSAISSDDHHPLPIF